MKHIHLTQNYVVLVDDEDYKELSAFKWYVEMNGGKPYAARRDRATRKRVLMHRVICRTPAGMDTDHRNGDTLDNQRKNLRTATKAQNAANQLARTGKYKGVSQNGKGWAARCGDNYLGTHQTPEAAAAAYDLFAYMAYGEFARLNGV